MPVSKSESAHDMLKSNMIRGRVGMTVSKSEFEYDMLKSNMQRGRVTPSVAKAKISSLRESGTFSETQVSELTAIADVLSADAPYDDSWYNETAFNALALEGIVGGSSAPDINAGDAGGDTDVSYDEFGIPIYYGADGSGTDGDRVDNLGNVIYIGEFGDVTDSYGHTVYFDSNGRRCNSDGSIYH